MLNTTKKCTKCDKIKDVSEYGKRKNSKVGLYPTCKECKNKRGALYNKTKVGVVKKIYDGQKYTSKRRGHIPPAYTKIELEDWVLAQPLFHRLYSDWVDSGYQMLLKPSIDRLDDYRGYSMSNIQLMTWGENKVKGENDKKNGINNKQSKAVKQFTLDGEFITEYHSVMEAERITKVSDTHIISCCKGRHKQASGFKWEYA